MHQDLLQRGPGQGQEIVRLIHGEDRRGVLPAMQLEDDASGRSSWGGAQRTAQRGTAGARRGRHACHDRQPPPRLLRDATPCSRDINVWVRLLTACHCGWRRSPANQARRLVGRGARGGASPHHHGPGRARCRSTCGAGSPADANSPNAATCVLCSAREMRKGEVPPRGPPAMAAAHHCSCCDIICRVPDPQPPCSPMRQDAPTIHSAACTQGTQPPPMPVIKRTHQPVTHMFPCPRPPPPRPPLPLLTGHLHYARQLGAHVTRRPCTSAGAGYYVSGEQLMSSCLDRHFTSGSDRATTTRGQHSAARAASPCCSTSRRSSACMAPWCKASASLRLAARPWDRRLWRCRRRACTLQSGAIGCAIGPVSLERGPGGRGWGLWKGKVVGWRPAGRRMATWAVWSGPCRFVVCCCVLAKLTCAAGWPPLGDWWQSP